MGSSATATGQIKSSLTNSADREGAIETSSPSGPLTTAPEEEKKQQKDEKTTRGLTSLDEINQTNPNLSGVANTSLNTDENA